MGIFSRTRDIIAANFNDMLDKADDPQKMIRMIILEMEETLVEVRASAARTIADQKEMHRHTVKLDRLQADWAEKAQLALSKDREDLARAALEEEGEVLIEGAYHLEVSSPGIDRPLTRAKDFANWVGHEAKIVLDKSAPGQRSLRGELRGIEGDTVTIVDRKAGEVAVPRELIHAASLVLTDALIAATRPLDTSGADEIEEVTEEKADD